MTNRRRFLATVAGTTVAVAGCSGSEDTDTPANSSPDSSTEELPDPDGGRNTGAVNGIERAYGIPNAVPIGTDGDRIITRANVEGEPAFVVFNYLTGERLWTRSIESYDTPAISAGGQIGHGRLYSIGSESDEDRYINVIDVATGDLLGTQEFESGGPSRSRIVPLDGGAFFITGIARGYTAFYINGDTAERESAFSPTDVWNLGQDTPTARDSLHPLTGGGMFVTGRNLADSDAEFRYGDTEPRVSLTLSARTNSYGTPRPSSESAVFGSGYDFPAKARSREDGSLLWERSDNSYYPPYGYGGNTLAYLGADEGERVIGVEPSNGDIRWERTDLDLPTGDFDSAVKTPYTVTDRALVVGTSNGIKLFSLADGATVARSEDTAFSSFLATQSRVLTTGSVMTEQGETNGTIVYTY